MSELKVDSVTPVDDIENEENKLKIDSITPLKVESITPLKEETPVKKDPLEEEAKNASVFRRIPDQAISLLKGAVSLPESAVGIADMVSGGQAGKKLEELGVRFKDTHKELEEFYSPQQRLANRKLAETKGFIPSIVMALKNPSTIHQSVLESVPSMIGAGGIGRGILKVAPKVGAVIGGAIGEGVISGGQTAEGIRQESETGTITPGQAAIAAGSGALTTAVTILGGKLAKRLNIMDWDTLLAGGGIKATVNDIQKAGKINVLKAAIGSAISEGAIEELPQSGQEKMADNLANGRPIFEGVEEASAMGLLTGSAMGVSAGVVGKTLAKRETGEAAGPTSDTFKKIEAGEVTQPEKSKPKTHIQVEGPMSDVDTELPEIKKKTIKKEIKKALKEIEEEKNAETLQEAETGAVEEGEVRETSENISSEDIQQLEEKGSEGDKRKSTPLTGEEGVKAKLTSVNVSKNKVDAKAKFKYATDDDIESYVRGELSEDEVYERIISNTVSEMELDSPRQIDDILGSTKELTNKERVEGLKSSDIDDTTEFSTDVSGKVTMTEVSPQTTREKKKAKLTLLKSEPGVPTLTDGITPTAETKSELKISNISEQKSDINVKAISDYYESLGLTPEESISLAAIDMDFITDNPEDAPKNMEEFKQYAKELAETQVELDEAEKEDTEIEENIDTDTTARIKEIVAKMKMSEEESETEVQKILKEKNERLAVEKEEKKETARQKKAKKVKEAKEAKVKEKKEKPKKKVVLPKEEATQTAEPQKEEKPKTVTRKKLSVETSDTSIQKLSEEEVEIITESLYETEEQAEKAREKLGVSKEKYNVKKVGTVGYVLEKSEKASIQIQVDPNYQTLEEASAVPRDTTTLTSATSTMLADVNVYLHTGKGDIAGIARQLENLLKNIESDPRRFMKEFKGDLATYNQWVSLVNSMAKYVRDVSIERSRVWGTTTTMDFMGMQSAYELIRRAINSLVRVYSRWKTKRVADKLKTIQQRVDGVGVMDMEYIAPKDVTALSKFFLSGGMLANKNISETARELAVDIREAEMFYLFKTATESNDIDELSKGLTDEQRKEITELGYHVRDYRKAMNEFLKKSGEKNKKKREAIIRANIDDYLAHQDPVIVEKYNQIRQIYNAWREEYKDFQKRMLNTKTPENFKKALEDYNEHGDMKKALIDNNIGQSEKKSRNAAEIDRFSSYYASIDEINNWGEEDYVTKIMVGYLTVSEMIPVVSKKTGNVKLDEDGNVVMKKHILTKAKDVLDAVEQITAIAKERYANDRTIGKVIIDHSFKFEGDVPTFLSKRQYRAFSRKLNKAIADAMNLPNISKKLKNIVGIKPGLIIAPPTLETEDILPGENDAFDILKAYSRMMWKKVAFDPVLDSMKEIDPTEVPKTVRAHLDNMLDAAKGKYWEGDKILDGILSALHLETNRAYSRFITRPMIQFVVNAKLGYRVLAGALNGIDGVARIGLEFREHYIKEGYKFLRTKEGKALVERNGWRLGSRIEDIGGHLKIKQSLLAPLGIFTLPELPVRELNYATAYLYYRDQRIAELAGQGKAIDTKAVMEEAEEFAKREAMVSVWKLQGSNTLAEKPEILRSPTGRLFGVFMPFFVRNAEFLWANKNSFGFWARYIGYVTMMSGPRGFLTMLKSLPLIELVMMARGDDKWLDKLEAWMMKNMPMSGGVASLGGMDIVGPATAQWPSSSSTLDTMLKIYKYGLSQIGNPDFRYQTKEGIKQTIIFAKNWWDIIDANVDKEGFVLDAEGNQKYSITSKWDMSMLAMGITPENKSIQQLTHRIVYRQKQIEKEQARHIVSEFRNSVQGMFHKGVDISIASQKAAEVAFEAAIKYHVSPETLIDVAENARIERSIKDLFGSSVLNRLEVYELEKQANPDFPAPMNR